MLRLAIALLLLLPAGAEALIVPQRSIMGVELEMTRAEVKAVAGEPDEVEKRPHEIVGQITEYRYGRTRVGIARNSGVIFVNTRDRSERTAEGVGIGSSKRFLRRNLSGERCRDEFGVHHCFLGAFRAGRTVTDFRLNKRNRVRSVTLGLVID
jgi:hypothetical protein